MSCQLPWALQGRHTRSIALSQVHQGFQRALGLNRPRVLKSITGPSASFRDLG